MKQYMKKISAGTWILIILVGISVIGNIVRLVGLYNGIIPYEDPIVYMKIATALWTAWEVLCLGWIIKDDIE